MVVHCSVLVACHHGQDHANSKTYSADMEGSLAFAKPGGLGERSNWLIWSLVTPRMLMMQESRYSLNDQDVDGSRIIVEFSRGGVGAPRGPGGSRKYLGRGPPPGRCCFNCGLDGHWAQDCKAGDWKNKCYRCGERGHVERNCQSSPKKTTKCGHSLSRSPSPRQGRS